jgi:hypothetical protein
MYLLMFYNSETDRTGDYISWPHGVFTSLVKARNAGTKLLKREGDSYTVHRIATDKAESMLPAIAWGDMKEHGITEVQSI